jgi:hypothetical protein
LVKPLAPSGTDRTDRRTTVRGSVYARRVRPLPRVTIAPIVSCRDKEVTSAKYFFGASLLETVTLGICTKFDLRWLVVEANSQIGSLEVLVLGSTPSESTRPSSSFVLVVCGLKSSKFTLEGPGFNSQSFNSILESFC